MGRSESSDTLVDLPVLRGRRVILRQPVHADIAVRAEVSREPEEDLMYGGVGEAKVFTEAEASARLDTFLHQDLTKERAFVIATMLWPDGRPVDHPDGRFIGTIRLHGIASADRKARLAVGIFDRRFWSHGFGTEAIRMLLRYGFEQMTLHRIDLRVLNFNTRAIHCYEKCGFVREGIERESARINGRWHSDVIMAILEHEYLSQPWAGDP